MRLNPLEACRRRQYLAKPNNMLRAITGSSLAITQSSLLEVNSKTRSFVEGIKCEALLLNTSDIEGGIARVPYRLHQGLQGVGVTSQMLVQV